MNQKFKEYFSISRQEYRGLIVLFVLLGLIYLAPYIYERFFFKPLEIKIETIKPALAQIDRYESTAYDNQEEDFHKPVLFRFNPNHLPVEDWIKLGLSEKQAHSIKKYEAKGGKFYKKEDVKKMYAISPAMYQRLEPYIDIPENKKETYTIDKKRESFPKKALIMVDVNDADSLQLLNIKGIGPAFASRIIKYRNRLGGFIRKEQLMEVYGLDSAKYVQIENQILIDKEKITPIHINTAEFADIKRFPYLSYKQMNAIIAYRKQHGAYKSITDLSKIHILNPEIISKIAPYIQF
ncbi:comEA protein [Pedobacter glucosidilyticus]|nr:helix-hairpin-helix domain-containing protein [Pedobacter glucosidilyticus]KHJ38454.1 comEA protein [Pedobacter glucosidilyticus]